MAAPKVGSLDTNTYIVQARYILIVCLTMQHKYSPMALYFTYNYNFKKFHVQFKMQFEPYIAVLSAIVITTGDRGQIDFPLSGMMSQNTVYIPPSRGGKR